MARKVTAEEGDTLCGIAIEAGFLNCNPLRAIPANRPFTSRPLVAGDVVVVPRLRPRLDDGATGASHRFRRLRIPKPRIRCVHGSADRSFEHDPSLDYVDISNYPTNRAGTTGTAAFTNAFGYDADADADPDTFKVEVVSPDRGDPIQVLLEALKPIYGAGGEVVGHEPFGGADHNARKLDVECKLASPPKKIYRSRYLRLTTDDTDHATGPSQTLLVTDLADGDDGANDQVEILDQRVRASYTLPRCPAASNKCTLVAEFQVGHAPKRVRQCVHVFRTTPGGPAVGGLTEKVIRRRIKKWFRRAYAQANLAPVLVDPVVEFIDPPAANMLVISQDAGARSSGVDSGGHPAKVRFRLGQPPGGVLSGWLHAISDPTVEVTLTPGLTPTEVGEAIVAALPRSYAGDVFTNATAFNAADPSCDVMITKDDGSRVMVRGESTTDTALTIEVARVNLSAVNDADTFNTIVPTTMDFRRVLRSADGADNRLDYFVIDRYANNGLRGRAFVAAPDLGAAYQPPAPLRWAVVMACRSSSGAVMDGSDNLPFTFPHEAGHVLNDAFHTSGANATTQMMRSGTSQANAVDASKRICDDPVLVSYAMFDPAQPAPGATVVTAISAVNRMRTRGASVITDW